MKDGEKLCGRITPHDPHQWFGWVFPGWYPWQKVEFRCPGRVLVEGGQRSTWRD